MKRMKQKKIILILFVFSLTFAGGSYMVAGDGFSLCANNATEYRDCITLVNNISEPIFWTFLPLLLITPILFFVRRETFFAWAKFAGVAFPLMLATMVYTFNYGKVYHSFGAGGLFSSDAEAAAVLFPPLFTILSLLIIAIKSWRLRGNKK